MPIMENVKMVIIYKDGRNDVINFNNYTSIINELGRLIYAWFKYKNMFEICQINLIYDK